jgi:hypothetical protein
LPDGRVIELIVRSNNPYYNPRRQGCQPTIPSPDQHIPDCHPQLAQVRSVTRDAFPSTLLPSDGGAEVREPGGANAPVPAAEPVDTDSDNEHDGIHPHLLREMTNSPLHLLTHMPFKRFCDACVLGKMKKTPKFRGAFDRDLRRWGDVISADHLDSKSDLNVSHEGHRFALAVKDIWSRLFAIYPVLNKSGGLAFGALQHFIGTRKVKLCYTDGSGELKHACRRLGISRDVSDPGIPATNGIIERTVGIVKQGARTTLIRAGFPSSFWSRAAARSCYHVNCDGSRGESPYFRTHGIEHDGLAIPVSSSCCLSTDIYT